MTTKIQFHLVNNTEMKLDAVWLRVDDAYFNTTEMAAHADLHFAMELPDKGDDRMTLSIQDYNWGLFGTNLQEKIVIDKKELSAPVLISIDAKSNDGSSHSFAVNPWVTVEDQKGNHHKKFTLDRRGAINGAVIPNGE